MKTVVITGSSRGIGLEMARAFLEQGWNVVVSGSSLASTQGAIEKLGSGYPAERILPVPCDVKEFSQVQALWDQAQAKYSTIDIWVNNAGTSGPRGDVWDLSPEDAQTVVDTNILGTIYGSQVAIRGMTEQSYGALYNMEGYGSDGKVRQGMAVIYGTSKAGIRFFNQSLAKELADSPILVGALHPGMVITDFVMQHFEDRPEDLERVRGIFNIIADRAENVSPWLVEKMLANKKSGALLSYSTTWRLLGRFITAPFSKRDVFAREELR
jgi:NAD(P)-dependent dehydrogenase (short-subunit alcohol dehydrogenase family)